MRWDELTAPDFAQAVGETGGVCLVPAGSIESHFDHMPLGTDCFNAHAICSLAAEQEPAIVFPPYYLGQVHEARCFPGAIAIPPELTFGVLRAVCDEIGRNGFRKIIIYNVHGGNTHLLNYLCQAHLERRRDYAVYLPERIEPEKRRKQWKKLLRTAAPGHACEWETSLGLASYPHLVKMDRLRGRKAEPLGRFDHIAPRGGITGRWYADFPDAYAGDATAATADKGRKLRQIAVDFLAEYVRAVKRDEVVPEVLDGFYARCEKLGQCVNGGEACDGKS